MINTWDIISRLNSQTGGLRYTLLIDGTEHDARLIAKKLRGYVSAPQQAQAPYVYAFALPEDLNEDTLEQIRVATREGIEQTNKVNQFVPGGILGEPLFNSEITQDDKDFPTFMTMDPSESFFQMTPEESKPKEISLDDIDVTGIERNHISLHSPGTTNLGNITGSTELPKSTPSVAPPPPTILRKKNSINLENTTSIPPQPPFSNTKMGAPADKPAHESTLAPKEAQKIDLDFTVPPSQATQSDLSATIDSKLELDLDAPNQSIEKTTSPLTEELPIDQRDMLIKDMEDTLLNKMPQVEDIFAAETKYDMFVDAEELSGPVAQQKRDSNITNLADGKDSLEETFNVFEQKIKEQTSIIDLEELTAITDRLSIKDMEFVKHANTSPELAAEIAANIAEEQAAQNQPKAAPESKQAFSPADAILNTDLPEIPLVRPAVQQTPASKPEEGDFMENKTNAELPQEVRLTDTMPPAPPQNPVTTDQPSDDLPNITIRETEVKAPESLEKTFHLTTTLDQEVMRSQYQKSFHNPQDPVPPHHTVSVTAPLQDMKPIEPKQPVAPVQAEQPEPPIPSVEPVGQQEPVLPEAPAPSVEPVEQQEPVSPVEPAQAVPQTPSTPTIRLKKKPEPSPLPTPEEVAPITERPSIAEPSPAPAMENTILRLRRKAGQEVSSLPAQPEPQVPPTQTSAQYTKVNTPKPAPNATPAVKRIPEKTKTIDHSIELPLSELKKHNWPLEVPLFPTYTLENMVMSVNRFAHATAISVIENPGRLYNPLVLHGATGTGKTHFLNAIAYAFSKKFGQENIFMTNGVRLSRGIQRYVMEGNIEKFERFMDTVKVLLIDDIHLLAINEQNRKYISTLLNKFLREQKQIVITSKYPPESLAKLEELIRFRLDSGWISELKPAGGSTHLKIVKKMLLENGVDLNDTQINNFFGGSKMTLSTTMRNIHRLKVLENLIFPQLSETERSQAALFEKLLATTGEDAGSEILSSTPDEITSISTVGDGEWGRIGFFYPQNCSNMMNWMVYALQQRAKELGIPGGFEITVRSSYATENIISSAFKIANLCDNKKLKGAVILGPTLNTCDPSVRENFYDILTHMLEIMLIRCGIINMEDVRAPSTYVKVLAELLR